MAVSPCLMGWGTGLNPSATTSNWNRTVCPHGSVFASVRLELNFLKEADGPRVPPHLHFTPLGLIALSQLVVLDLEPL